MPTAVSERGRQAADELLAGASPASLAGDQLLAAIEALAATRTSRAADVLAGIRQPKDAAKAARRALFKLQSQGIRPSEAPAPAEEEPLARATSAAKITLLEGQVSSYDPRGTRAVSILAEKPFTGLVSLFAIASDTDGLLDAELSATTKKAFHARLENFSKQFAAIEFVPVPADYANQVVHRSSQRNQASAQPVPQDFTMWRSLGAEAPAEPIEAPILSELPAEDVRQRVPLDHTGDLARTEFEAWTFDQERLKEHLTRLDTARGGPLVLSEDAQKERERSIINEAADAIFQGEELDRARERLLDTAHLLFVQGNPEQAEICLRAALDVGEGAPHDHPFLREIIAHSFQEATGEAHEHQHEAEQPQGPARTESGLILPA